ETIFVAHSPLARGLLASRKPSKVAIKPGDFRHTNKRSQLLRADMTRSVESGLRDISLEYGVQPAVIALAAILARSPRVAVIPGSKSPEQIQICMQTSELSIDSDSLRLPWKPSD
ncbi:MAG: aldo/keto reductase, partial [Aliivibrio sp.]|uniref:aldo/keto reductase n=1 Tax=Aliivibrio sp. TaxID=1872443 RepID=UPI001A39BA6F|nr:aldo/keto reductase [Aliivibrio sp.]